MASALDEADLVAINAALVSIADVEEDVKRAGVAGIDVGQAAVDLEERKAKLQRIKSAYFPNEA